MSTSFNIGGSSQIAGVEIGGGAPLALIAGLNVLEDQAAAISLAQALRECARRHDFPLVFKASFDKANRTRDDGFRGPGLDAGLEMLRAVKRETGLPLLTDVHEIAQAQAVSQVVDVLQIPAFLCRQTDLVRACAATGLPVNIKKGQFVAAADLAYAVEKARGAGDGGVLVTERGTSFGARDLVVDMRGLVEMRRFAPVCFDATHSVQRPGASGGSSGGDRHFVAPLARAAVAVGIDALFVEVHSAPESAPVDSACQLDLAAFDALLASVRALASATADSAR